MDKRDKKEIESLVAEFLALLTLVRVKQACLESFCVEHLDSLGFLPRNGKSLLEDLKKYQERELNQCLSSMADDQPMVASELKRILESHFP